MLTGRRTRLPRRDGRRPALSGVHGTDQPVGEKPEMPKDFGRWVIGALFAIIGVFALYAASRAVDDVMYYTGIALFIIAALFNFVLIKQHYDGLGSH
jgi:hypothetical protein